MNNQKIDVIATTISGSIKDWSKVKYIVPLFKKNGLDTLTRIFITCPFHTPGA